MPFQADGPFDLVYRPLASGKLTGEHSISEAETEIGYFSGDGLALEDALREQSLLLVPSKPLCREDCKGICASCGQNRNLNDCNCKPAIADPRLPNTNGKNYPRTGVPLPGVPRAGGKETFVKARPEST